MAILSIVGGQYGSEGKGVIANYFAPQMDVAVRTGGPNAGHSIIHEGRVWKMRSIPVAWTNPRTQLVLGPGAVIDPGVLYRETEDLEEAGYSIQDRLWIDPKATILVPADITDEKDDGIIDRIGSTGKGIGAARVRRMERDHTYWEWPRDELTRCHVAPTGPIIEPVAANDDAWVMLEGTQGFGLSLTHGQWPYVTSADCTVQQLWNDAGIHPEGLTHTILVFRSYPIRVAGNSGPLKGELSWEEMAQRLGKPGLEERTTVTNKVRRIGTFDWDLAVEAVRINHPQTLALTFADYIDPSIEGHRYWGTVGSSTPVRAFIDKMQETLNVRVGLVGTGGPEWSVVATPADPLGNHRDTRFGQDHDGTSLGSLLRDIVSSQ